jgi:hypothetical protein
LDCRWICFSRGEIHGRNKEKKKKKKAGVFHDSSPCFKHSPAVWLLLLGYYLILLSLAAIALCTSRRRKNKFSSSSKFCLSENQKKISAMDSIIELISTTGIIF